MSISSGRLLIRVVELGGRSVTSLVGNQWRGNGGSLLDVPLLYNRLHGAGQVRE